MRSRARLCSHALTVPLRVAFDGSTLETRNTSSRRPSIAWATSSSVPYISAVSMCVRPSSTPSRSAATASLPDSSQVP